MSLYRTRLRQGFKFLILPEIYFNDSQHAVVEVFDSPEDPQ